MSDQSSIKYKAFTLQSKEKSFHQIISHVKVSEANSHNASENDIIKINALWDTGASKSCISKSLARKLKLKPIGTMKVLHAGGSSNSFKYFLSLILPNDFILNVDVLEFNKSSNNFDLLLGMDVISSGDFAISKRNGKSLFSFMVPEYSPIDFEKEAEILNKAIKNNLGEDDICPCGSGLKFKNCHMKR